MPKPARSIGERFGATIRHESARIVEESTEISIVVLWMVFVGIGAFGPGGSPVGTEFSNDP